MISQSDLCNLISALCAFISACAVERCQEMRGERDMDVGIDTNQRSQLESNRKCLNHSVWCAFKPLGQ